MKYICRNIRAILLLYQRNRSAHLKSYRHTSRRKRYRTRFDPLRAMSIKSILWLSALMPLPVAHLFGAGLGWLMVLFPNRSRQVARINIGLCFPELDDREQAGLVRRCLIEMGKTLMETGILWLGSEARFERLIKEVRGEEIVRAGLEKERGVIVIAPHIGSWETVGIYCSARYPMTSLYRPPQIYELDKIIRGSRERTGATLVPTDVQGVKALYKALADNHVTGILPDQDPRDGGRFAPFFGVQANTMVLLSRLARKTQATPVLVFAERLPRGKGFRMRFEAVPEAISGNDLDASVCALNVAVEGLVRRYPAQYQWGYKRFNCRPEGEPYLY